MGIFLRKRNWVKIACCVCLLFALEPKPSNAFGPKCTAGGQAPNDCIDEIRDDHKDKLRPDVAVHTSEKFSDHRLWMLDDFFRGQVLPALMLFTEQMSAVAMQQTFAIGTFIDAKHQLETQRLMQELQNEAHKDYQPSETFCHFGTNVRSLAASEQKGRAASLYLARKQMARHLGQKNIAGSAGRTEDKAGRWQEFTTTFCDPKDNNWFSNGNGLDLACQNPTPNPEYTNADIDYTRLIENARTISLKSDGSGLDFDLAGGFAPSIRKSIYAMSSNLYGHNVLNRSLFSEGKLEERSLQEKYLQLRSVAAKRGVAENSFNAIVGLKSQGTTSPSPADANTYEFLGAIIKELGVPEAEVFQYVGRRPSYYAQLEILAKKIYQNPDFYAGLYDKPANVKRKRVALQAIELMLDRAIYESQMRQELAASVLLSARLHEPFQKVDNALDGGN